MSQMICVEVDMIKQPKKKYVFRKWEDLQQALNEFIADGWKKEAVLQFAAVVSRDAQKAGIRSWVHFTIK